ncbi:MAG: hypothetical protein OXH75_27035 [Acidobacteria bacterium]|nr:hypothetical protein [Acidobacteriota bacterium]
MREHRLSFEAALNDAIRRGLSESAADAEPRFTVTARPMRLRSGADPVRLQDLDAALEVRRFQALDATSTRARVAVTI